MYIYNIVDFRGFDSSIISRDNVSREIGRDKCKHKANTIR